MRVRIYDTTLRDGTQAEDLSFSAEDKLRVAEKVDELGVHYIEGGWPGSNDKDVRFFELARGLKLKNAKLAAFCSTCRADTAPNRDDNVQKLLKAETPVVTIFGKSWDLHVAEALRIPLERNLEIIEETVAYLKARVDEVFYDAEHFFDGYRADPDYALATPAQGGADVLVLCDTNGGALPLDVSRVVAEVRRRVGTPLGIHCHNDGDL